MSVSREREAFDNSQVEKEVVDTDGFLRRIRLLLPNPCKIFYPGSGDDTFLEPVFGREEIYYLDKDETCLTGYAPNFSAGRYDEVSYMDDFWDAIVYKDSHMPLEAFIRMLRAVRVGGLVIRENFTCDDEFTPDEMRLIPGLRELSLSYEVNSHWKLLVFEKVPPSQTL